MNHEYGLCCKWERWNFWTPEREFVNPNYIACLDSIQEDLEWQVLAYQKGHWEIRNDLELGRDTMLDRWAKETVEA